MICTYMCELATAGNGSIIIINVKKISLVVN